jgi:hypothetical protein
VLPLHYRGVDIAIPRFEGVQAPTDGQRVVSLAHVLDSLRPAGFGQLVTAAAPRFSAGGVVSIPCFGNHRALSVVRTLEPLTLTPTSMWQSGPRNTLPKPFVGRHLVHGQRLVAGIEMPTVATVS